VPDLIICDLYLGDGIDGPSLIDRLREEYNQPIPALLVTADPSARPQQLAAAGGLVLLYKPLSPQALRQAVASALAPSAEAKAAPA
jgi:CheY-like chemotaxis protein